MFKLWVADLDSPSYFVAVAAVDLGFFKREGVDVSLLVNTKEGPEKLRKGEVHFIGGPAYAVTRTYPGWRGAKILCALSHYSYWFLAVRSGLDVKRGDLDAIKGMRISAAMSWPGMGLRHMLSEAGIDLVRDKVEIVPPPPPYGDKGWMARNGVQAIEQGIADAYWGNGMRVAIGESLGVAKLHLDLRRGDGPPGARGYNFAALATTDELVEKHPEVAAAAVRAIVKTQKALKANPSLATEVGERLFPPDEAVLIRGLIERDAPFYDAHISHEAVAGLNKFAKAIGLIEEPVPYEQLIAMNSKQFWDE